MVKAIVLRTAGVNCDAETVHALKLAGADVDLVHVNSLIAGKVTLDSYSILVIPGGFSYGDDLGGGRVLATQLVRKLRGPLDKFVQDGKIVIGVCNGFQVLTQAGLLPGKLDANASGKFECRWVRLKAAPSLFTKNIEYIEMPVAHGEGRVVGDVYDNAVFLYVDSEGEEAEYPANPNGSAHGIAGVVNEKGNVLGMMPHPERNIYTESHPSWTQGHVGGEGLKIYQNAVRYAEEHL